MRFCTQFPFLVILIGLLASCQPTQDSSDAELMKSQKRVVEAASSLVQSKSLEKHIADQSFGRYFAMLNRKELLLLQNTLEGVLAINKSEANELLEAYLTQLYIHDPAEALLFVSAYLELSYETRLLGARLAADWFDNDEAKVIAYLEGLLHQKGAKNTANVKRILRLIVEPRNQRFDVDVWLSWIDSLENASQVVTLRGAALEAILEDVHPSMDSDFQRIEQSFLKYANEDGFHPYLYRFANVIAQHHPERVLDFINALPVGDSRNKVAMISVQQVSEIQPDIVADWLSNESSLEALISTGHSNWNETFDQYLMVYIEQLAKQYPEDAELNLRSIIQEGKNEQFRLRIENLAQEVRADREKAHQATILNLPDQWPEDPR